MTSTPFTDHVPTEVHTARLLLRAPRPGDGRAVHAAVMASLPELRPWMAWAHNPLDEAGYEANLTRAAERFETREELRYLMIDASTGELVGSTGFHNVNWHVPKAEIGYWIVTRHAGRGLVTEAARALTDLGLGTLGLRRIEIRCDAANERSARVPRRLGYTLDARLVNDDVAADDPTRLRDTLVFSRVR